MNNFKSIQKIELDSWISNNPKVNRDKMIRETIRYPLLKKQMGLDYLDTTDMIVADIGTGLYGGISTVLNCKRVDRYDSLMDEYKKYYYQNNGIAIKAEDLKEKLNEYDLIIITNALDHFSQPFLFLEQLKNYMKPGGFFSSLHAINNSYTHKHDAHAHSINPEIMHQYLDDTFETVWELKYPELRYGWHEYNGKIGQPAFSLLMRKVIGY